MVTLGQVLRYGARALSKKSGFTFMAVFMLALGIGGTTIFISVADTAYRRPLLSVQAEQRVKGDALYEAVRCWTDRERWWFSKVHAVALGLASIGVVAFELIWHLFDFSLRY